MTILAKLLITVWFTNGQPVQNTYMYFDTLTQCNAAKAQMTADLPNHQPPKGYWSDASYSCSWVIVALPFNPPAP